MPHWAYTILTIAAVVFVAVNLAWFVVFNSRLIRIKGILLIGTMAVAPPSFSIVVKQFGVEIDGGGMSWPTFALAGLVVMTLGWLEYRHETSRIWGETSDALLEYCTALASGKSAEIRQAMVERHRQNPFVDKNVFAIYTAIELAQLSKKKQ